MAHYAEIINNKVTQVIVTNNDWTHEETLEWLNANISTNEWVQTSYNAKIRNKFAGIGDDYIDGVFYESEEVVFENLGDLRNV